MSKFCSGCGNQLPEDARFCNSCGMAANANNSPEVPEQLIENIGTHKETKNKNKTKAKEKKKGKRVLIYLILIMMVCLAAAATYLLRDMIWDAWLKRGEIISVNGVALKEKDAAAFSVDADEEAWKNQEDIDKVKKLIEGQVEKLQKAAGKKDLNNMIKLFSQEKRQQYLGIFEKDKEDLVLLGEAFKEMDMVYLSPKVDSKADTNKRIAEYHVRYQGQSFSVVFIFEGGKWLIYSM